MTWNLGGGLMRVTKRIVGATVFVLALCVKGFPYTVVTISTAAPQGIEQTFLAATTAQFNATITPNPFAANTYTMQIFGLNPNYVAPSSGTPFMLSIQIDSTTLNSDLTALIQAGPAIITNPYLYGFADGMGYQQKVTETDVEYLGSLCGSATNFILVQTTTATFSANTCVDMSSTLDTMLYNMSLSTPTPIPPEPL